MTLASFFGRAVTNKQPTIITISRQMASGGGYLGHLLARKLGYRYIERQVLYQAAQELDTDIRELSSRDERTSGFLESLMKSFVFGTPEAAYAPPSGRPVYDRDLFERESAIIRSAADQYNAVILGRGGYWILRNHANALHLFIHASMEFRIHRYRRFIPGMRNRSGSCLKNRTGTVKNF